MSRYLSQDEINEKKWMNEWKAKQCLPKFNVLYPNVVKCTILYTRKAEGIEGWIEDKEPQTMHINLEDSSMVTIPCLNKDCTKRNFDLKDIIHNMINHHETEKNGKLICDGYQDAERVDIHQCLCELRYKIKIDYK